MSGDAPTPAAGSSIWNHNGLLDPASLRQSSLMAPPTMNGSGDQLNSYENSRLFVVCGKSVEADALSEAFARFGHIQSVRLVRDKGVAYVKYDKASSAAAAIEALHETSLCDGRGPMLKVMVAEAPTRRSGSLGRQPETEFAADPDNIPPRSRLFMVVPKTADGSIIEEEMSKFRDLEYCKIDLIAAKGIVFVKYAKSSSALLALESILANDCMVSDYKVKVMIAEPKGKRGRRDPLFSEAFAHAIQQPGLEYGTSHLGPYSAMSARRFTSQGLPASALHPLTDARASSGSLSGLAAGYPPAHQVLPQHEQHMDGMSSNFGIGSALHGHGHGLGNFSSLANSNGLALDRPGSWRQEDGSSEGFGMAMNMNIAQIQAMAADLGARTLGQAIANQGMTHNSSLGNKHPGSLLNGISEEGQDTSVYQSPMHLEHMASHSLTRLYIVVSKAVADDTLEYLFGVFEGLEYVDLKRDHVSGLSRGFAYVKYNNSISAASAVERYNGFELPTGSGLRLKVMYAENLQVRPGGKGTPPLLPSRSLSARSDSTSSILQPRAGEMISPGVQSTTMGREESTPDLRSQRYAEVAALQNSLAHMSMPHSSELGMYGYNTPPPHRGQRSPLLSPSDQETSTWVHLPVAEGDKDEGADSGSVPAHMCRPDDFTIFTELSRPMPDYALEHVFAQHGPVEWVRLRPDERYGVVRFGTAEAVQSAIDALHGTKICGEKIGVTRGDPLTGAHSNSKRPRMAPAQQDHMLSCAF